MSRPWVGGPFQPRDRSPPSSCRYINSGAIIGVCAFSQGPLDPAAAPLSYSFRLSRSCLSLLTPLSIPAYPLPPSSPQPSLLPPPPSPSPPPPPPPPPPSPSPLSSPRSPPLHSLLLTGYATPPLSCLFFLASSSVC